MNEEEMKNTDNLKNSEEQTSNEEIEYLKNQNLLHRQLGNYQNKSFFRMMITQEVTAVGEELQRVGKILEIGLKTLNQELSSMTKKISNQNKILAAKLGVEIE